MGKDLLVYLALNGSKYSKGASVYASQGVPSLPCTIEEVLSDVKECFACGVRLVHMHSRNLSGEHKTDAKWYQRVASVLKVQYPELRFCFATSRAGEVMEQIHDQYVLLRHRFSELDARTNSEMLRLACLEAVEKRELPHFLTAFTATEVRINNANADIGHVKDAPCSEVIKRFVKNTLEPSKTKDVCHEIEVTSTSSMDIIESLQQEYNFSSPLSIVILPGFTQDFRFSAHVLDELLPRAKKVIEKAGKGLITLGRILPPGSKNIKNKRWEHVEYALHHPCIDAIRVGIEDAPYWDEKPSTNVELVRSTIDCALKLNGNITTNMNLNESL